MKKKILVTGATDGIGYETVKKLLSKGHHVLAHGRSDTKLKKIQSELSANGFIETFSADLSDLSQVKRLAEEVKQKHKTLDILINNAGVFKLRNPQTNSGLDQRFLVNTVAPYLLTRELLGSFVSDGRVVNLSSAAQAPVNLQALTGKCQLDDSQAYAQSKLAITMWTFHMAKNNETPSFIAVNPASFLASKMVKEAYGTAGKDLSIGADILFEAAISEKFKNASGRYYDNDIQAFANPNRDALDVSKNSTLVDQVEEIIETLL